MESMRVSIGNCVEIIAQAFHSASQTHASIIKGF